MTQEELHQHMRSMGLVVIHTITTADQLEHDLSFKVIRTWELNGKYLCDDPLTTTRKIGLPVAWGFDVENKSIMIWLDGSLPRKEGEE